MHALISRNQCQKEAHKACQHKFKTQFKLRITWAVCWEIFSRTIAFALSNTDSECQFLELNLSLFYFKLNHPP